MSRGDQVRRSKLMSLLLRHDPARGDLDPDPAGWVEVRALLAALDRLGLPTTRVELDAVVEEGSKPRFEIRDGRIRARYGHSIDVTLGYERSEPPNRLYHGTARRRLDAILSEGIAPMGRRMVHLSTDVRSATQVGARHGQPVVLVVDAASMHAEGHAFYEVAGGTWLTAEVPPAYLRSRATDLEADHG